ncbi:MmcQ/YjbR family DNA-binding protein [Streptococcus massiliensis]|uniref:MmcQ family protein n=1 Tax=Streptococcus massiliensis TaxID=313439 RepID=A0A380KYT4_9STRE|nr:MmcQ/YjbR family DNA-binding protein [Streptococcus massiliensis]SUN76096.1 MmcQ family protein [Streptococcus massiliensis]
MENLFEKYQAVPEKLLAYGFTKEVDIYVYQTTIMAGDFELCVQVKNNRVTYQLFDLDTGDEYIQVHQASMMGKFVGQVRAACTEVLLDIRESCFEAAGFLNEQSHRLVDYVAQTYQGRMEYLWKNSSKNRANHTGVFRHQHSKKWYGLFMTIDWSKLNPARTGKVEVINVKSDRVVDLVKQSGIYPAYHMNKKYWLSLPLDGGLADEQIQSLLDHGFQLTKSSSDE